MDEFRNDPSKYEPWKYPCTWDVFQELYVYVDVPMHLTLHGITRTCTFSSQTWFQQSRQNTNFINKYAAYNNMILKDIKVEYAKYLDYKGENFGGMVGENWRAMNSLGPWFYQNIDCLKVSETENQPPPTDDPRKGKWRKNIYAYRI